MREFGIINQDGQFCIYDQDEHRPVLRVNKFSDIISWIYDHPGKYEFNVEVVIQFDDQNMSV